MKLHIYILVFLFISCAGSSSHKSINADEDFKSNMPENAERSNEAITFDKQVDKQNFEKRVQKTVDESNLTADVITDRNFDAIGRQKLQEVIDISYLVFDDKTQTKMKDYALKHAHRLFANKTEDLLLQQLKKTYFKSADSARISDLKLQKIKEVSANEQVANYSFKLQTYLQGKPSKMVIKRAQIYFKVVDLNLDGKIYKTINSKILTVE